MNSSALLRSGYRGFSSAGKAVKFVETAKLKGRIATKANYLVCFEDGRISEEDFDSLSPPAKQITANML